MAKSKHPEGVSHPADMDKGPTGLDDGAGSKPDPKQQIHLLRWHKIKHHLTWQGKSILCLRGHARNQIRLLTAWAESMGSASFISPFGRDVAGRRRLRQTIKDLNRTLKKNSIGLLFQRNGTAYTCCCKLSFMESAD